VRPPTRATADGEWREPNLRFSPLRIARGQPRFKPTGRPKERLAILSREKLCREIMNAMREKTHCPPIISLTRSAAAGSANRAPLFLTPRSGIKPVGLVRRCTERDIFRRAEAIVDDRRALTNLAVASELHRFRFPGSFADDDLHRSAPVSPKCVHRRVSGLPWTFRDHSKSRGGACAGERNLASAYPRAPAPRRRAARAHAGGTDHGPTPQPRRRTDADPRATAGVMTRTA